jgi:hypothetical protein
VAHEHDGSAFIEGVLDRGERGGNARGIRDGAGLFVLGNIEVDAHENAFAFYGNVFDGFFHSNGKFESEGGTGLSEKE